MKKIRQNYFTGVQHTAQSNPPVCNTPHKQVHRCATHRTIKVTGVQHTGQSARCVVHSSLIGPLISPVCLPPINNEGSPTKTIFPVYNTPRNQYAACISQARNSGVSFFFGGGGVICLAWFITYFHVAKKLYSLLTHSL